MATNNSANNEYLSNADGAQIKGGTTARILKWLSADITLTGGGTNTYTFPAATDTLVGRASTDTLTNKTITDSTNTVYDSRVKITRLTSDAASNSTTTGAKITGLDTATGTGTFKFEYWIVYQAGATGTGVRFGVNHSGTVTFIVANMRYQESTTAASTGAASQAAVGGTLHGGASCRALSTTTPNLATTISVDAANSNMLMIIEGIIVVSATGDLQLYHASEVAAASTVKAHSSLILTKLP